MTAINDGAIMIGNNTIEKSVRFPGNLRSKTNAKRNPAMPSKIVTTTAKMRVNLRAPQKSGAERIVLKLSNPAGVISNSLSMSRESEVFTPR